MATSISATHVRHQSCSFRGADVSVDDCESFDGETVTAAAVAELAVRIARHELFACGSAGSGGGHYDLFIDGEWVGDTSDCSAADVFGSVAGLAGLPHGSISPDLVAELAAPVWDGSNFTPVDVSALAPFAGLDPCGVGYCDAYDWINNGDIGDMTADDVISEARSQGIYLNPRDVAECIASRS